jgi:mono/diheme cytochrome c family protein
MRGVGLLVLAVLAFGGRATLAQDVGDESKGHAFAREVCAVCHAVEAGHAESPHPGAPTFERIAAEPGMTAMALFVFLRTPHREMPDLILAPDEMSDVIAYILTLKPTD